MNIYSWIVIIFLIILILIFALQQKLKKNLFKILFVASILFVLVPRIIPGQLFGNWNALKKLNDKKVTLIILRPSSPGWKVNLTNDVVRIIDSGKIDIIVNLLHNAKFYESSHPIRIWETDIILYTKDDSLKLNVQKNENYKGTIIIGGSSSNELRLDKFGEYLEIITNYKSPS